MIREQYVSFETAKLLKEKGFPQHVASHTYFVGDDKKRGCVVGEFVGHPSEETDTHLIDAPTQQMAMRWLREVHKIFIQIDYDYYVNDGFYYGYSTIRLEQKNEYDEVETKIGDRLFNTYEEACEAGIEYCLKKLTKYTEKYF